MTPRAALVCLLTIATLVALPGSLRAEHTRYWKQSDFSEFQKGTPKGVAIRSDGRLTPAPKFAPLADPNLAYLWALHLDSQGRLYAAGGSDAKVLRFDDAGKATTVFESAELMAQTIAFDAKNNLYVGTSPDGKVYRVTPDGTKSVFFEPKTKYIWALAVDPQGSLFVATGDTGEVFVVTPDGKGQLFYQSKERHARSLAFDAKGDLLIGTEPDGLILRVKIVRKNGASFPEAVEPFVVYETSKAEVTSLATDANGNVYAASIGEKGGNRTIGGGLTNPAAPTPAGANNPPGTLSPQAQSIVVQVTGPSLPLPTSGGAEVVKIAADGSPETLWTSHDDLVLTMGFSAAGKLLLGTGNSGTLIELEGNGVFENVAKTAAAQVTSFATGTGGKIFVATANPGKVFALGPGYESNGSFESDTFDAKIFSHWGRLTWWGDNGATDGKVAFYVRTGNTSSPEENWSAWAGPYKNAGGDTPDCPPARFAQWKAVFSDTAQGQAPDVSWVSFAYLPKNVTPVIDDVAVQNPGVRVMGYASQPSGPGTPAPVPLRAPHAAGAGPFATFSNADTASAKVDIPPQGVEEKGYQSVLWSAHDDNDDDLVFAIYFRGEKDKDWRLLKDKITQHYYSWDTNSMPDGAYYLKIVVSDSPANPGDQALSAERESDRLEIANAPPRIENLRAGAGTPDTKASFDAVSPSGAIAKAQYSVDAGDWKMIFPAGLLSDSPKETYSVDIPGLPAGVHTLGVQVIDRFGNTTAAETTFTISQQRGAQ